MKDEFARPGQQTKVRGDKETRRQGDKETRVKAAVRKRPRSRADRNGAAGAKEGSFKHTDKVLYPDGGITKGDVLDFYIRIAQRLLPYLRDRPVTLERLPDGLGAGKPHFWQKTTPAYYPDWIRRAELTTERNKVVPYVLVNDAQTLLYL